MRLRFGHRTINGAASTRAPGRMPQLSSWGGAGREAVDGVLRLAFRAAQDKRMIAREKYGVEYCDRTVSMSEAARRAVEKINAA